MIQSKLFNIINQGESEVLEFKTNFSRSVIESLVAFSNTSGGSVIIGCNDHKENVGVSAIKESIQRWVNEIKQNTIPQIIPDVEFIKFKNKQVDSLKVIEYPVKPIAFRNKYFKRLANSNHLLGVIDIANKYLRTINSSWDFYLDPNHDMLDLSSDKMDGFLSKIEMNTGDKINGSTTDFLSKLEILKNNRITFGSYLLFSKNDCAISDIQLGRFKSDITIIDSWSLQTDLFTEIDEVMAFIKKHLMVEYVITGEPQHQERFDYPLNAIREIVINRVVHRDYRDSSASIIKIFDDRIEFFNPGKLFGGLTLKDLTSNNETSRARNKLIARAFKEVGLIEQYGSGIKRIIIYYKNHGIGLPKFEEVFEGFRVTLYKQVSDKVTESNIKFNTDKLSANQRQISNIINDNKDFTTSKLAEIIGISQRKIKENIAKLKVTGVLKRIGSAKGGYWIMEDQSNKIRNN